MSARALAEANFGPLVSVIPPGAELHPSSAISPDQLGKCPGRLIDGGWVGYAFTRTAVSVEEMEQSGANVGLLGDRFPALDIDCNEPALAQAVLQMAEERFGAVPIRLSKEPRRLLVFRTAAPFQRMGLVITYRGTGHLVEWLGAGRQYLVHGKHPSGADYRWDTQDLWDFMPEDLPEITAAEAERFLSDLAAELRRRGIECELVGKAKEKTEEIRPQDDLQAPTFAVLADLMASLPNPKEFDRAKYMEMMYAVKAAAGQEDGLGIFQEWASRWQGGENAPETVQRDWESLSPPYRLGWEWLTGQGAQLTGYNAAADEFDTIEEDAPEGPSRFGQLGFIRIKEFLEMPRAPVTWVLDGMLPASGLSLFVAKPKVGKSTLARSLAVAVATGSPWLGRQTNKGPVLYIALEDSQDLLQEEFERLGAGDCDLYVWSGRAPKDAIKMLREDAKAFQPSLIIVDTLQRLIRVKDLNDYSQVTAASEPLLSLARETAAHTMFLHHAPKGDREDTSDAPLGSQALFGTVDTLIHMKRNQSGTRFLETRQRRGEDFPASTVEMDETTHWPKVVGVKADTDAGDAEARVLRFMVEAGEPLTEDQIAAGAGVATKLLRTSIRSMVERDVLVRTGAGKKGDKYKYAVLDLLAGVTSA